MESSGSNVAAFRPSEKKVCKKSVNCGKIEITQEADFLWEEEKENQ